MHINIPDIIPQVERMNPEQLDRLQEAVDRRRRQLGDEPVSAVVERRSYANGILQLERRAYRRKDGGLTERGPYWYFHFREGGKQRTIYVGKAGDPGAVVDEKLGEEPTKGENMMGKCGNGEDSIYEPKKNSGEGRVTHQGEHEGVPAVRA